MTTGTAYQRLLRQLRDDGRPVEDTGTAEPMPSAPPTTTLTCR